MSIAPNRLGARAAAAGIVAPFAFLTGLAATSRVESDFMDAKNWTPWPVGLGLGPERWLWWATCIALGLPLLVFGIAVARGQVSRVGGTAFAIAGIGGLLIAPPVEVAQMVGSLLFLLGFVVGSVALWRSIRKSPDWRGTRRWMAIGLAVLAPLLVLPPERLTVLDADPVPGYLMNAVLLAPLAVMATRLLVIATDMDLRWLRHHWFYLLALVGLYFVCRQGQSWPLVIGMLVVYVVAATLVIHWQYVNWLSDAAPKTLPYWMLWSILGVGLVCVVVGFLRGWLGESRLVAWLLFPGIILSYLSAGWLMVRARSQASSSMQRRIGLWSTAICVLATGGGLLALATVDKPPKAAALVAFGLLAAPVGISLLAERAVDFFRTQWQTHARRVACTMLGGTAVAVGVATWVGALHDELWLTVALLALAALIVAMVSGTLADVFVVLGVIALIGVTPQSEPVHTVAPKSRVLVALGDSYMSGEGGDTYFEGTDVGGVNQCRRAPTAWAVQAGQRYFDDTVFLACSGARTYNVRHDTLGAQIPEPRRQDGELGTQLDQWVDLSKSAGYEAGLVVVSIGGNDAGFSTVGKVCGAPGSCDTPEMNHWFIDELPQVRKELTSTFQEVRDTFPKTPIAVTAYPDPIYGSKPCADLALTSGDVRFIKNFLTKLNETVHAATRAAGVAYIDGTQDALAKAGAQLCDPVNGSRPGVNFVGLRSVSGLADQRFNPMNWIHNSFHPNERGHAALLRVFDRWWVTTGRTLQAPGPVSDSAAVDGRLITPQCDLVGDGVDVPRCRSNADRWMVQKLARSATPILALTLLVVGPAWLASAAFFGWRRARRT